MKMQFLPLIILASLILSPALIAAPNVEQLIRTARAELLKGKSRPAAAEEVAAYRELRERPEFATNGAARVYLTDQIVRLCGKPGMHTVSRWDGKLMDEVPTEAKRILDDKELSLRQKSAFAWYLATYLASEKEDFAAAEKVLDDLLAGFPKEKPFEKALVELNRVTLYRWQDRYDDAFRILAERVRPADPKRAAAAASALAIELHDMKKATPFWEKAGGEASELGYYAGKRDRFGDQPFYEECRARAKAYVENKDNPLQSRMSVVIDYFCGQSTDEERALRASVKEADFTKSGWNVEPKLQAAIQYDDFELALELMELFKAREKWHGFYKTKTVRNRVKIVCLGAVGRKDEAAALALAAAGEKGTDPVDAVKFRVSAAILKGEDPGPVVAVAGLPAADAAKVWRTAARQALLWKDSPTAERCAEEFAKLHVESPKRSMKVAWSDKTIGGISDWRAIAPSLDRQFADLKYRMSVEDLVTDVATGGRSPIEASALDAEDARVEISSVCDRKGVHVFLRVADPNARAVEAGFAGGIGGEFYFSPGPDRPYIVFAASPKDGFQRYNFVTSYERLGYMRPNVKDERTDIEGVTFDVEFSDSDYVEHLFFPWSNYFTDLPTDGHPWRFECVSWMPKGSYTWAGSHGPHQMMGWGDLVFALTPAQTTAIRRELLCKTRGNWRKTGCLDVFEKWADDEIGDPGFYAERLKPLETELAAAMSGVKPDMSDEEVNRIFELALVKCRGLKHEIDALRKDYLRREFCN